jgi:hypothetical protein
MELLVRGVSELGSSVNWLAVAFVLIVGVLLAYIGIVLAAILATYDLARARIWRQVLRDLLDVFRTLREFATPAGGPRWTKSHVDRLLHARHVWQRAGL